MEVNPHVTDYWLSKLLYDLQHPHLAEEFGCDAASVLDRYPLGDDARRAVLNDDVAAIAARVNPYLLRYHFGRRGMSDEEFIDRLQPCAVKSRHG